MTERISFWHCKYSPFQIVNFRETHCGAFVAVLKSLVEAVTENRHCFLERKPPSIFRSQKLNSGSKEIKLQWRKRRFCLKLTIFKFWNPIEDFIGIRLISYSQKTCRQALPWTGLWMTFMQMGQSNLLSKYSMTACFFLSSSSTGSNSTSSVLFRFPSSDPISMPSSIRPISGLAGEPWRIHFKIFSRVQMKAFHCLKENKIIRILERLEL